MLDSQPSVYPLDNNTIHAYAPLKSNKAPSKSIIAVTQTILIVTLLVSSLSFAALLHFTANKYIKDPLDKVTSVYDYAMPIYQAYSEFVLPLFQSALFISLPIFIASYLYLAKSLNGDESLNHSTFKKVVYSLGLVITVLTMIWYLTSRVNLFLNGGSIHRLSTHIIIGILVTVFLVSFLFLEINRKEQR